MCNLKSNKGLKEILEYKKGLGVPKTEVELVVFPSNIHISFFYDASYKIGSQNVSSYNAASVTGEVLARQLKSLKVSYVLINHFEVNDTFDDVIEKIRNVTKQNIKAVLCIGEKEHQTMEETIDEISLEIDKIFIKLKKKELENLILAYEPCWAINGQDIINTNVINNIVKAMKEKVEKRYNLNLPVIYGGGINVKNVKELIKLTNLDGYILGNCANNPENIGKILSILQKST